MLSGELFPCRFSLSILSDGRRGQRCEDTTFFEIRGMYAAFSLGKANTPNSVSRVCRVNMLSRPFICHRPPTTYNILLPWCLMADTADDFKRRPNVGLWFHGVSLLVIMVRGWSKFASNSFPLQWTIAYLKRRFLFTAAQRQPYPCTTARLLLHNSNLTVEQR